jgi:hypothetical protein
MTAQEMREALIKSRTPAEETTNPPQEITPPPQSEEPKAEEKPQETPSEPTEKVEPPKSVEKDDLETPGGDEEPLKKRTGRRLSERQKKLEDELRASLSERDSIIAELRREIATANKRVAQKDLADVEAKYPIPKQADYDDMEDWKRDYDEAMRARSQMKQVFDKYDQQSKAAPPRQETPFDIAAGHMAKADPELHKTIAPVMQSTYKALEGLVMYSQFGPAAMKIIAKDVPLERWKALGIEGQRQTFLQAEAYLQDYMAKNYKPQGQEAPAEESNKKAPPKIGENLAGGTPAPQGDRLKSLIQERAKAQGIANYRNRAGGF